MTASKIGYLDEVWNPYSPNCIKVSPGCANCYAEAQQQGFGRTFRGAPQWSASALDRFAQLSPHTVVGINFLSDTLHPDAPLEWIDRIHAHVASRPNNIFLYTTKRSERLAEIAKLVTWPSNLWVGVSVENPDYRYRIDHLRQVPTANRWVSFEPLLEEIQHVRLEGIGWVVVGGESGALRRPFEKKWAKTLHTLALESHIPFYFKQGSNRYPDNDRVLDGRTWDQVPDAFSAIRAVAVPSPEQLKLF